MLAPDYPTHMEYKIEDTKLVAVKSTALQAMKELEGWCTDNKASILIDLILESKPTIIVEIGVFGGKSLVPMAFALKENNWGKALLPDIVPL